MRPEHWLYTIPLRLRTFFHRRHVEQELDEELRDHLDRTIEENLARGLTPEEARYVALRAMDGLEQRKEECRDARGVRVFDDLLRDIRFALRVLCKSPGFTTVAVLTLALGVAANTVVFSAVSALLLKPLPFPNSDRIVVVWHSDPEHGVFRGLPSPAEFSEWWLRSHCFEQLAAWRTWFSQLGGPGEAEQVWSVRTSPNFFDLLHASAALGRTYSEGDSPGANDSEVVISHGLWMARFSSDPGIIGRAINVDGRRVTVVGVLKPDFRLFSGSRSYDVWTPYRFEAGSARWDDNSIIVFGRLKLGVTAEAAQGEMSALGRQISAEHSEAIGTPLLLSLRDNNIGNSRPTLALLAAAVGLVLLVACANVANLLLTRTSGRNREIAIRLAVGAPRSSILRQCLTESMIISLAGCAAGVLLSLAGLAWLHLHPGAGLGEIAYASQIVLDRRTLGFTVIVSLLTGIVLGCAPAWHAGSYQPGDALRGGFSVASPHTRSAGRLLAGMEVAVTTALLVAAALVLTGFSQLLHRELGFDPHHVVTARVWMPEERYSTSERVVAFLDASLRILRSLPGIESASAINFLPLSGWGDSATLLIPGRSEAVNVQYRVIDSQYFHTVAIAMVAGRELQGDERGFAVINQEAARRYWPDEDVLGRRIAIAFPKVPAPWRPRAVNMTVTIVGVARDTAEVSPSAPIPPQIFVSYRDVPSRLMSFAVRTAGESLQVGQSVQAALRGIEREQPVDEIKSLDELVAQSTGRQRVATGLLTAFVVLALIMAATGVYGVLSYSVVQRTREIGVRMVVGACRSDVLRLVMLEGTWIALAGLASGAVLAWISVRVLAALLPGVASWQLTPLAVAGGVLLLVVMLAVYTPARRATRVDPMSALRSE